MDNKEFHKFEPSNTNVCPHCGYCPHCGRGGVWYPWWGAYPYSTPNYTIHSCTTTGGSGA